MTGSVLAASAAAAPAAIAPPAATAPTRPTGWVSAAAGSSRIVSPLRASGTASRAASSSDADANRRFGSFSSARITMSSSSEGIGANVEGGGGSSLTWRYIVAIGVSALNGTRPVSISYRTHPSA